MRSEVADVTQVLSNTSVKVFFSTKTGAGGQLYPQIFVWEATAPLCPSYAAVYEREGTLSVTQLA